MRRAGIAFGTVLLGLGPWLGLFHVSPARSESHAIPSWFHPSVDAPQDAPVSNRPAVDAATPASDPADTGCTCQTVVVNAKNFVKDAKVRSGDARVVNVNVTYVAPDFVQNGDASIDVDQEAEATSGDAIAGQIIGIAAHSAGRCTHVVVNALNEVIDSKVRSGDARAENKNFVLLAPGVRKGDVDIDVHQKAHAKSGAAVAGQILGIDGGGGPCGGVDVRASNDVRDTKVRSGEARFDNENSITQCETSGCVKELWLLVRRERLKGARICAADGCTFVSADDLHAMYHEMKAAEDVADGTPAPRTKHEKPTPTPDETPEATPTPTPSPSPTPADGLGPMAAPAN